MGYDAYGDEPMTMGVDSSGNPIHHYGDERIGDVDGMHLQHGVTIGDVEAHDHSMDDPAGTPFHTVHIPHEQPTHVEIPGLPDFVNREFDKYYYETTHPDPNKDARDPQTDAAQRQQDASHQPDDDSTNPHVLHTPDHEF